MGTTLAETIRLAIVDVLTDDLNTVLKDLSLPRVAIEAVGSANEPRRTEKLPCVYVALTGWERLDSTISEEGFEHRIYNVLITHGVKTQFGKTDVVAWGNQLHDAIGKVLEDNWALPVSSCPDGLADDVVVVGGTVDPWATQAESNVVHWGELNVVVRVTRQLTTHGGE